MTKENTSISVNSEPACWQECPTIKVINREFGKQLARDIDNRSRMLDQALRSGDNTGIEQLTPPPVPVSPNQLFKEDLVAGCPGGPEKMYGFLWRICQSKNV